MNTLRKYQNMKKAISKTLKYLVYTLISTVIILVIFNVLFTFFIHKKIGNAVSKSGRWPAGAYVYDEKIGFDFAPNISGKINDGSFHVKSHELGFRIGENEDNVSYRPGGVLSLGCSVTYGDEVNSEQTFTQIIADGFNIPAYNYGISSFSYIHALLKARKLEQQGILDKLKPKYVILGCWSGLPNRSRSPFPPMASRSIPLPAAYIDREGGELAIQYPLNLRLAFDLIEIYREQGPGLSLKKFIKIYFATPRFVYLYLKNNRLAEKIRDHSFKNDVTNKELYDFYFSGIEDVFSKYNSQIIVLYMPMTRNERIDSGILEALANHKEIIFVDGTRAIQKHNVAPGDYVGRHPQPSAHMAYAVETQKRIKLKEQTK